MGQEEPPTNLFDMPQQTIPERGESRVGLSTHLLGLLWRSHASLPKFLLGYTIRRNGPPVQMMKRLPDVDTR